MTKLLIHGFGSYPLFFFSLAKHFPEGLADFDWSVLLTTATYLNEARRSLPSERIHYLQPAIRRRMAGAADVATVGTLPGSLHRFIDGDKKTIKRWNGDRQLRYALAVYAEYKALLLQVRPDAIFFPPAETAEANILAAVARELSIEIVSCLNARHLGGSFFAQDIVEGLPAYAQADPGSRHRAREFLRTFRDGAIPVMNIQPIADRLDAAAPGGTEEAVRMPGRLARLRTYVTSLAEEPEAATAEGVRVRLMNSLPVLSPLLRRTVRGTRKAANATFLRSHQAAALPERFVFYPLQYSPESSINMPAPYYVDQLRVVDAIRHSMPNDHLLVVKEHPAALEMRPASFLKELAKRSGVVLVDTAWSSRDIVQRAALTISVTGSAAFEAFLLGRPSLVLGPCFFAEFLGGVTGIDGLADKMRRRMADCVADEDIVEAIGRAYACISPFLFMAPDYGYGAKYALRRANLSAFLAAFKDHLAQTSRFRLGAREAPSR